MKVTEADILADKISRTWRGSIPAQLWSEVLIHLDHAHAERAWEELRDTEQHQPTIAQFRTRYATFGVQAEDGHPLSCLCGGSGWVTVTERNEHISWEAYARCPKGPATGFTEPSAAYHHHAGVEAFRTFNALVASATTRKELVEACHAAALAYRNAARLEHTYQQRAAELFSPLTP